MDMHYLQVGALPYRISGDGSPELLLVTSRGTSRWIIPKGWPMEGLSDAEAAAREAYEEAGLMGEITETPVGSFTYEKVRKGMDTPSLLRVDVYLLRVDRQLAYWPEASQRTLAWVSPDQAVSLVSDAGLGELIAGLRLPSA
jgi:8-oxo-dGTP pyrophosphatase MutT (NUDIX family)